MLSHEDLWIKISNDFHAEINPILEEINAESKLSYWFDQKGIPGKLIIINNVLLSINGNEANQFHLTRLIGIIESCKIRIARYFETHNIATSFVFFAPEKLSFSSDYFNSIEKYAITYNRISQLGGYTFFQIGMEIIGFPNDCSYKLTGKISNNEVLITTQHDPVFPIEVERGKQIGNTNRTRREQYEIENQLRRQNPELRKESEVEIFQKFTVFAEKAHIQIKALIEDFDRCINLCNSIIEKKQKDTTPANLPEIKKIYSVLINGYIQEPIERFLAIFQPDYSGEKITWLKSGWELKYFVDRLNDKMNISIKINQWTDSRFVLKEPVKNLVRHLAKQTTSFYYQNLLDHNHKSHILYRLFKE